MEDLKLSELKERCTKQWKDNGDCVGCQFYNEQKKECVFANIPVKPQYWAIEETAKPSKQDLIKEPQNPSLAKFVYLGNDNVIINTDEIAYIYRDNKTCIVYKNGQKIYVDTGVSNVLKIIYQLD